MVARDLPRGIEIAIEQATRQPRCISKRAVAAPMPRAAPVTATRMIFSSISRQASLLRSLHAAGLNGP